MTKNLSAEELFALIQKHRTSVNSVERWSPEHQAPEMEPVFHADWSEPILRNKKFVTVDTGLEPTEHNMVAIGWTDRRQEIVEQHLGAELLESERLRSVIADYGSQWKHVASSWPDNLGIKSLVPVSFLEPYSPGITLKLHELAKTKEFSSMRMARESTTLTITIGLDENGKAKVLGDSRMPSIMRRGYPVYEGDELLDRFGVHVDSSWRANLMAERAMCEYIGRLELTQPFDQMDCALCGTTFWPQALHAFAIGKAGVPRYCPDCYLLRNDVWRKIPLGLDERRALAIRGIELVTELTGLFPFRNLKKQAIAHLEPEERDRWMMAQIFMPGDSVKELFGSWEEMLTQTDALGARPRKGRGGYVSTSSCGHTCLSVGERMVCERLAELGIEHQKEPVYPEHPTLNPSGRLRGDWLVNGTWVEFAGYLDDSTYRRKMGEKQELARLLGLRHLVLIPADLRRLDEAVKSVLSDQLDSPERAD